MRILAIAGELDPQRIGGAEAHFIEVSKRISPKVEKLTVISNIDYPHAPNFNWLFYSIFVLPKALREKFDLIWLKQEYLVWAGWFLKLLTGKPVYVTCQNPNLATEEWVGKGIMAKFFQKYFGGAFNHFLMFPLRFMDTVAAVSSYSANLAKRYGANKVVIVPNGVDIGRFSGKTKTDRKLKVVTTSSLIPRNGIDTLIQACALLPKSINWQLNIAGDGPEEKSLKELAKSLPVSFLGRIANTKISRLLRQSNLFIRPSRFEGFGSSFIEAMATGLPVIGTPVGGIVDFVENGKNGFLVEPENPQELAKIMVHLVEDQRLTNKIALAGQKLVKEKYNWDNIADKVYYELKKICG